ncbi:hypothetical protein DFH06DRAFT_1193838 [Mycena polygramma]|nr:hypothetical protein DFH06DRAFT_1193838 [Mycena polygramma]
MYCQHSLRPQSVWTRLVLCGLASLALLWLLIPVHGSSMLLSMIVDLGPAFPDIRFYERNLPQHVPPALLSKGKDRPRYVFFPQASWGSGWNNIFQEQLLNTHLAYLSQRAYVFPDYIARDHQPFETKLPNYVRPWLHIPTNAFVAGPTAGGPLSADGNSDSLMRRAVSEEWWHVVCPPEEVVVVNLSETMLELELDDKSEGEEIMSKWARKLSDMDAPCVSVEGDSVFSYQFIGSRRVISIWSSYGESPTLKYFAWSPLITAALFRNFHVVSPDPPPYALTPIGGEPYRFRSFRPYRASEAPIAGLLGIHVRRGDFEQHCRFLANERMDYNAWSLLDYVWPALPDYLNASEGQSRWDATIAHCWPSTNAIVARVRDVLRGPQNIWRVYIATNGDLPWVENLSALLRAEGVDVSSSFDMKLTEEEHAVAQVVDMSVLTAAEAFIGVGFSSLTSNVVQIRLAGGRDPSTIHFW